MKEAHAKAKLLKRARAKVKRGARAHKGNASQADWDRYQDRRHYLRRQATKQYHEKKKREAALAARIGWLARWYNWLKNPFARKKD